MVSMIRVGVSSNVGVSPYGSNHRTSDDEHLGCFFTSFRKVFRFHAPILSFGEPGSLGSGASWIKKLSKADDLHASSCDL